MQPGENRSHGLLSAGPFLFSCILGDSGITRFKKEGDHATPAGSFRLLYGYFREDRIILPSTGLTMLPVMQGDGWCDEPGHPAYNQPVKLPFSASHENLHRVDGLYDICLVLDYNISPQIRNRGSAIFFHLTRPDRKPTEGCVAIDRGNMLKLLPYISTRTVMSIG